MANRATLTRFRNHSSDFSGRLKALGLLVPQEISVEKLLNFLLQAPSLETLCSAEQDAFSLVSPIVLVGNYELFDFTKGYDAHRPLRSTHGWGRYCENRIGMYNAELFRDGDEPRTVHMGVDLGTRAGTAVYAMTNCEVFGVAFRGGKGDYGGTLILKADFSASPFPLFMLYGHLSRASLLILKENQRVKAGDLIGWVGESHENGGWNPHVHIQFSWLEPAQVDLPGAVAVSDSELASLIFPDPTRAIQNAQAGWPLTSAFS